MCYMIYCKGKLCFMYLSTVACWGWCHPTVESDLVVFLPHFNWLPSVKWLRSSSWSELFTVGRLRVGTFFKRCSNEHFDTRWFLLKNSHTNASKLLLCTLTYNFCNVSISFLLHRVHVKSVLIAKRHWYREKEPSVFSLVPCEAHRHGAV